MSDKQPMSKKEKDELRTGLLQFAEQYRGTDQESLASAHATWMLEWVDTDLRLADWLWAQGASNDPAPS